MRSTVCCFKNETGEIEEYWYKCGDGGLYDLVIHDQPDPDVACASGPVSQVAIAESSGEMIRATIKCNWDSDTIFNMFTEYLPKQHKQRIAPKLRRRFNNIMAHNCHLIGRYNGKPKEDGKLPP